MSHYPCFDLREKIELGGNWQFAFCEKLPLDMLNLHALNFTGYLPLPGCFDVFEQFAGKKGTGCYRTDFTLKKEALLRLHIGGMGLACRIFCDGKEVGSSHMPFTPLDFDFRAGAGCHTLLIAVDNRCDEEKIPQFQLECDFYAYGGVYYELSLSTLPEFRIERIQVTTLDLDTGCVKLEVRFGGHVPEETELSLSFDNGAEENVLCRITDRRAVLERNVPFPRVWSPDSPALHCVRCAIRGDAVTERFGLRKIEIRGRSLLLNGKPLKLLGVNRHEHHPDFGYALPDAIHVNDLMLMKQCGCNFVRGSHYPQNQHFLDCCDEMGILVWEEGLAWGRKPSPNLLNPVFRESQRNNLTAMIQASFNHPSVILWGFLNECASTETESKPVYAELAALVKRLDPCRPVTFAVVQTRDHQVFEFADVISMNCYPGWYDTEDEEIRTIDNIQPFLRDTIGYIDSLPETRDKPFIISEIGAAALPGFHDRFHARWTGEYQADYHQAVTGCGCGEDRVAGVALWMFCDARTGMQGRILRRPRGFNNKGIFDEYRRPKEAVSVVRKNFRRQ